MSIPKRKGDKGGWLRLHRKIRAHPRYRDSEFIHVWIHFLLSAEFKERSDFFDGKPIKLQPGQFISSRREISEMTRVNSAKVLRVINDLLSDQQIEQQAGKKHSMFTVMNWRKYQENDPSDDPSDDPQMIHDRSMTDPSLIHENQNHKAGVRKSEPKKKRTLEAKGGGEMEVKKGVPVFRPLSSKLFPAELREMLLAVDESVRALRENPDNLVRSTALKTSVAEDVAWLEEQAGKRPQESEKILAQAEAIRADKESYQVTGFTAEALAALKAWKERREKIKQALAGVVEL